jgi:hypothetical protein
MRRYHRAGISTLQIHMSRGVRSGTGVEGNREDISVSYYIMDIEFCDPMAPHVRLSSTRCTVSRMLPRVFRYGLLYQMARNRLSRGVKRKPFRHLILRKLHSCRSYHDELHDHAYPSKV